MKNAVHTQVVKKLAAKSAKVAASPIATLKQTSAPVISQTTSTDQAAKPGYYRGAIKKAEADLAKMRTGEHEEELVIETKEEKKLEVIRKEVEIVNRAPGAMDGWRTVRVRSRSV